MELEDAEYSPVLEIDAACSYSRRLILLVDASPSGIVSRLLGGLPFVESQCLFPFPWEWQSAECRLGLRLKLREPSSRGD